MKKLFEPYEPRAVYPVFADRDNRLSYVLRATYIATPRAATRHALGRLFRRDHHTSMRFLTRIVLDSLTGIRLRFRGAYLDRDGNLLAEIPVFADIGYKQGIDISVNSLITDAGQEIQDGQFLLICDRGIKLDGGYGIGTVGATYHTPVGFSCYRNGAFARPINDFSHHRPTGFRSIAPHLSISKDIETSAYFFNFSTDPNYQFSANPKVTLLISDGRKLEANFGEIPPFGAREASISKIFGPGAKKFLSKENIGATLIAEQSGVTIGSLHIVRNLKNGAMGIEHTRPTHMYIA
jgi:hypothetical protein